MTATDLRAYAETEIARLGLGDSDANCHGVAVYDADEDQLDEDQLADLGDAAAVVLSDGIGLHAVCRTTDEIDAELETVAEWYAESK